MLGTSGKKKPALGRLDENGIIANGVIRRPHSRTPPACIGEQAAARARMGQGSCGRCPGCVGPWGRPFFTGCALQTGDLCTGAPCAGPKISGFSIRGACPPPPPMPKAPATAAPPAEPASYEAALEELEQLVGRIESGQLPLDQMLAGYQRGAALLAFCRKRLDAVQDQIKVLDEGGLHAWTPE